MKNNKIVVRVKNFLWTDVRLTDILLGVIVGVLGTVLIFRIFRII